LKLFAFAGARIRFVQVLPANFIFTLSLGQKSDLAEQADQLRNFSRLEFVNPVAAHQRGRYFDHKSIGARSVSNSVFERRLALFNFIASLTP